MIEGVEVVGYGRPASEALAKAVGRAKAGGGPLAPVTVIVPSNFAGLAARRLLGAGLVGEGSGVANVSFLPPFQLAQLLASDLLLDRRPLTNPVLGAAVRLVLAEDPGPFRASANHHATEAALAELYAELSNISAESLARLESQGSAAARLAVRFGRAIAAHLGDFHDEADVFRAAAGRPDLDRALTPFGRIVWHLPEPTTAPMARFVGAVLASAPSQVVAGSTGCEDADRAVWATCALAGVDLPRSGAGAVAPPVASAIVTTTDADEEVRAVVGRVTALAESGVPLDRIGVFVPTPDPYVTALAQHLEAAGIPANGPSRRRLADSVAGRTLLAALALPSQRWRRDRVMALVSGAPVRDEGEAARPWAWERLSRAIGVVQDPADWRRKVATHLAALDARRRLVDEVPDPEGAEVERRAVQLARLERESHDVMRMGAFVERLVASVAAVDAAVGWAAKAAAATHLLQDLLGPGAHDSWPDDERSSLDRVEDALIRLSTLDELEPSPTQEVFVQALTAELDVTRGRSGRFGEGVWYGPLAAAVGLDLDAVFVLGCTEGVWPTARRDDALLPDASRALTDGELSLHGDRLHDQHRLLLAALGAAPVGSRTVTFPRGDLRGGRGNLPSRWLLESASALAGDVVYATTFAELGPPVVDVVPSFVAGLTAGRSHASLGDRDLAAMLAHTQSGGAPHLHPVGALVERGLEAQRARRSPDLTEWDGNLAGEPITTTDERPLSPSRLQSWAGCGFRYLLAYELGLDERDDPERILDLSPLDRGSGVHRALELFFDEVIRSGPPHPDQPWTGADRRRLREIAESVLDDLEQTGRTGRPVIWRLTRADLLDVLDQFLTVDEQHRAATRSRPERVELPFGFEEGGVGPVVLELPGGRRLRFRGIADRIDRRADDGVIVSDYKTGKGDAYKALKESDRNPHPDPVQGGTMLQLGLYAEAAVQHLGAERAAARYWMVDPRPRFADFGYDWTPERRDRLVEVLDAIVRGIESGVFAAVPGDYDSWRRTHEQCRHCDFDRLCPRDRGEQAEVKVSAPELRVRDALAWEVEG